MVERVVAQWWSIPCHLQVVLGEQLLVSVGNNELDESMA